MINFFKLKKKITNYGGIIMPKKKKKRYEGTMGDYLLHPEKYKFSLRDL